MSLSFFSRKKLVILLHILAWTFFFVLPVYLFGFNTRRDTYFLITIYTHVVVYISLFYISYFFLIPYLYFRRRRKIFFLALFGLVVGFYFLIQIVFTYVRQPNANKQFEAAMTELMAEYNIPRPSRQMHVFNYLFTTFLVTGLSLGLRYSEKYLQNEKRRKELEQEHLNSELAMLKNQVSPHFFFNTLNNIYSLIEISTEDARQAVHKLSKLMRYLLYESDNNKSLLSRDIDFMKNYIDLMKLRINEKVDLKVSFPNQEPDIELPPLLFISFIENAFKHGISSREPSFIHINMTLENEKIRFQCRNSIFKQEHELKDNSSGIGLDNIRKRLALLFPEKHNLVINEMPNQFEVLLDVSLSENSVL